MDTVGAALVLKFAGKNLLAGPSCFLVPYR